MRWIAHQTDGLERHLTSHQVKEGLALEGLAREGVCNR